MKKIIAFLISYNENIIFFIKKSCVSFSAKLNYKNVCKDNILFNFPLFVFLMNPLHIFVKNFRPKRSIFLIKVKIYFPLYFNLYSTWYVETFIFKRIIVKRTTRFLQNVFWHLTCYVMRFVYTFWNIIGK